MLINVDHVYFFFFNYSHNQCNVLRNININGGTWMNDEKESNESLFMDRCLFFPLTCFSLVTFPRNLG